jgi:hypothetical protein
LGAGSGCFERFELFFFDAWLTIRRAGITNKDDRRDHIRLLAHNPALALSNMAPPKLTRTQTPMAALR